MLGSSNLPKGPLYDPKSKIKNFEIDQDFDNITLIASREKILYEDPRPLDNLYFNTEWKRPKEICERPYFINGKPSRFDAIQGDDLGDCWLVIAIEGLTFHEELIRHVVPPDQSFDDNYTGAFHFRFWQLGVWYDVVVDDRLPVYRDNQQLKFCHSKSGNVFWAALLEKAYCKINGRQSNKYMDLKGGRPNTSFQDLSGGIVEVVDLMKPPPGRPLKWFLNQVCLKGALLGTFISGTYSDTDPPNTGLFSMHAYLISSVFHCQDEDSNYNGLFLIRLTNPWGEGEWIGEWSDFDIDNWGQMNREIRQVMNYKDEDDGEFWMSENEFLKYFRFMYTCHLGPSQYHYTHSANKVPTWSITTFRGEWVKGFNSVGPDIDKRHINPQYKIVLRSPTNDPDNDGAITVVIEITQRSPKRRKIRPLVGFYIYKLRNIKDQNPKERLEKEFFDDPKNVPVYEVDWIKGEGRAYSESLYLTPGWYSIICAAYEDVSTCFLLRVFAESEVEHWEYDTRVSKSSPINEEPNEMNFVGEELKSFFDESAKNEEIDWIGLKDVLEKIMNRNSHHGTLASFFKTSKVSQSSKGHENAYLVFSKDECRSIIAMIDQDNSGKLDFNEFCCLWKKILLLCQVYDTYRDSEEYLKLNKLRDALSSLGFNLNKQVILSLIHLYGNEQCQIILTDFILCGVILETFFTRYEKDRIKKGLKFTLEEWVKNVLAV